MEFVSGTFLTSPDYIQSQLSGLILGPNSGMDNYIRNVRMGEWEDRPILYNMVGPWVSAWLVHSRVPRFWNNIHERPSLPEVQLFVKPEYRRMGIGRAIVAHAKALWGEFSICPWDDTSCKFFDSIRGGEANG